MRRLTSIALLLAVILLLQPSVLADEFTEKGNAFMEDFIKAMNTGNYSLIEPYMSERLKKELGEREFAQLREFTLTNYGKLLSFSFVNESREGDMVKLEYEVRAEKGSFPVALTYENGELVGIGLGVRAKPNPAGMVAMIIGSLLVLGAFYFIRKPSIPDIVLGAGIALGLSVIIPFYGIISLIVAYSTVARALFTAFTTAMTVEAVKFYFSRNRDGLSLGLGLGIGQYVLLSIGTFVATNFIMQLPVSFTGPTYWAFLDAAIFTAFHALSAETYSKLRDIRLLGLFVLIEGLALGSTAFHVGISLLLGLIGVAFGIRFGGVIDGIAGREAR